MSIQIGIPERTEGKVRSCAGSGQEDIRGETWINGYGRLAGIT